MKTKNQIRKQALDLRLKIPLNNIDNYNSNIYNKLIDLIKNYKYESVHCYISFKSEPSTIKILEYFLSNNINIYVPVIINSVMHSSKITNTNFINGPYDIPEPKEINSASLNTKFDLIIVPTLAFDEHKNRLGYGKGYYDRFLIKQKSAYTVGLSYEQNKVQNLPINEHDVSLKTIITQSNVY